MGDLADNERHWIDLLTGRAGNALLPLPVDLYWAEPVELAIDCPQRAKILAEWAIDLHRKAVPIGHKVVLMIV